MSKASKYTTLLLRKLWTAIAVLLVVVALFISLLRYSLPLLDDRKHIIENYVLNEYGIDLSIGKVSASWKSRGPSLEFADVHLRQGEQSPVSLKVSEVYLAVEFWSSVFSGKLQSRNVTLSDLHLTLDVQRIESANTDFPVVKALESVFLEQLSKFSVSNSEFTLVNNDAQNTVRIRQLSWLNKNNRHQGLGELSLEGFASNTAVFILDLEGDVDSYNGLFYARGEDLDISPWINEFTNLDNQLINSKGNFEFWADIDEGKFTDLKGHISPSVFAFKAGDETNSDKPIQSTISAKFAARPVDETWQLALNDLSVSTNDTHFTSDWRGSLSQDAGIMLHNETTLDLSKLLPLSALLSKQLAKQVTDMQLDIQMPQLFIQVNTDGLAVVSQEAKLSWLELGDIPGLSQMNVDMFLSSNGSLLKAYTENSQLQASHMFDRALQIHVLDLPIWISKLDDQWSISSKGGKLAADALVMRPNFSYQFDSGTLSVMADIEQLPLKQVPSFLPNNYIGEGAKTFLSKAFVGEGEVKHAHVLWQGPASGFPFQDNSGVFQASVAIEDADFVFSNEWPALNELNINLLFENQRLFMKADSGYLADVELSNLRADISNLGKDGLLTIKADGNSDGAAVAKLMSNSALKESLGRVLSQDVIVTGPVSTELGLYIPLDNASQTRAVGKAKLAQSDVRITALGLDFEQANGVIAFDNETLTIENLQASLFSQAVSIDLEGQQEEQAYELDIAIAGNWGAEPLLKEYAPEFLASIEGSAAWELDVDVSLQQGDYAYTAQLSSDLMALDSNLPAPFNHSAGSAFPLKISAQGDKIASNIVASLGKDVSFEGVLPHKEKQFSRAHLALGQTDFVGMGVGFSISANLPSIDADLWYQTVSAFIGDIQGQNTSIFSAPERVFAQADQLLISGTRITDADITAKRMGADWQLDISSDQARGTVDIYEAWVSKGVVVDADYIKLNDIDLSFDATSVERSFDPKNLPTIRLNCEQCEVGDIQLGRVVLNAEPNNDGLEITRLELENESGAIRASGQWYQRHQDHYTFIAGSLDSKDFGRLLSDFGLDSGVKDSEANMQFTLTWKDSPMDFAFTHLDGNIDWSLTDGYLTEVSDKGSRIFTLLSLNSLVRKLSLDFRDVFAKGFFYDEMGGSIQITDGKADTRDTSIDGAAGDIEIYGFTDLVSKDLNYNVSFTPNVTGNLPVLVYFFTVSPPSALAALAIDQVLTSTKVISNVNYSVTGTIDDPILIETGRESTEVELPTRRQAEEDEGLNFLPPTVDDLLPLEQKDG